jgi:hypothetical protein
VVVALVDGHENAFQAEEVAAGYAVVPAADLLEGVVAMVKEFGDEICGIDVALWFSRGGRSCLIPLVEEVPEAVDDFVI